MSLSTQIVTGYTLKAQNFDFPDSVLMSDHQAGSDQQPRRSVPLDVVVYLAITALVATVWKISQMGFFEAGDDAGYWLGVAGGVMLLMLFSYPLRKHFTFARNWGRVKWWFLIHMLLGVGGPSLILLHSTFRVGSLNAGVALYSMLAVAISGVIGRFIFARVNRGLRGEKASLNELQSKAGLQQEEARSRLSFAPQVEARLIAFEKSELNAHAGWLTYSRQVFWLPLQQWLTYRECALELHRILKTLARRDNWNQKDLSKRELHSKKLVSQYLNAVTRVAQFTAYARLFSLWHIAHVPFVYLMVISAIVHVVAVHAY